MASHSFFLAQTAARSSQRSLPLLSLTRHHAEGAIAGGAPSAHICSLFAHVTSRSWTVAPSSVSQQGRSDEDRRSFLICMVVECRTFFARTVALSSHGRSVLVSAQPITTRKERLRQEFLPYLNGCEVIAPSSCGCPLLPDTQSLLPGIEGRAFLWPNHNQQGAIETGFPSSFGGSLHGRSFLA